MAKVVDSLTFTIVGSRDSGSQHAIIAYTCRDDVNTDLKTGAKEVRVDMSQFMLQAASLLTPTQAQALWYLLLNVAESNERIAQTVPPNTPDWPYGAMIAVSAVDQVSAHLAWQEPFSNAPVIGYRVFVNATEVASLAGNVLEYDLGNLAPGQTYLVRVEATQNGQGWSTDGAQGVVQTAAE